MSHPHEPHEVGAHVVKHHLGRIRALMAEVEHEAAMHADTARATLETPTEVPPEPPQASEGSPA